ncbi:MAG: right-handed parallel beta-helix repeat-containing protein [Verrucomicrobiota bacterium]
MHSRRLAGGNQGAGIEIISGRLIRIGNTNAAARNVIGGNDGPAVLVKSRTSYPPPFTVVQGNWIGLHPNGLEALGNAIGIQALNETSGIVIGGVEPGAGNVISGNRGPGIGIEMVSRLLGVSINGNLIGLSADGKARVGNGGPGVQVVNTPELIQIGDVQPESRNIISGNQVGVQLSGASSSTVKIQNNFIGTDGAGTNALGNTQDGILCQSFRSATIRSNVISGNGGHGINLGWTGIVSVEVSDNSIGVGVIARPGLGNGGDGIRLDLREAGQFQSVLIQRNAVCDNGQHGLELLDDGVQTNSTPLVQITDNLIGLANRPSSGIGNRGSGVRLVQTASNQIYNNVIAFNGLAGPEALDPLGHGIELSSAHLTQVRFNQIFSNGLAGVTMSGYFTNDPGAGNRISRNSIYDNGQLGIDLESFGSGVSANDPTDADQGPNLLQNFPVLKRVYVDPANPARQLVEGFLNSRPNRDYVIEFFSNRERDPSGFGEGERFVAALTVRTDAGGQVWFTNSVPGDVLNLAWTATDAEGNTSEFSTYAPIIVNMTTDEPDADPADGLPDVDLRAPGLQTTLRAAIEFANSEPGPDVIFFDIPVEGAPVIRPASPLPPIRESLRIDGTSQGNLGPRPRLVAGQVDLDGSQAGSTDGLVLLAEEQVVGGLLIHGFQGHGVLTTTNVPKLHLEAVDIQDNGRWGVYSFAEEVRVNKGAPGVLYPARSSRASLISRNGKSLNGGGVYSRDRLLASIVEVLANQGPGLFARQSVKVRSVKVNDNIGPGIQSWSDSIDVDLGEPGFDEEVQVMRNEGMGLVASMNPIFMPLGSGPDVFPNRIHSLTSMQVRDNGGWGVFTSDGSILLNAVDQQTPPTTTNLTRVVNNGNRALRCFAAGEDGALGQPLEDRWRGGGIGVSRGHITARILEVRDNKLGAGLVASGSIDLSSVRSLGNGGPGIQSLRGNILVGFARVNLDEVSNNQGPGIFAGSLLARDLRPTASLSKRSIDLLMPIRVSGNAGWGIYN